VIPSDEELLIARDAAHLLQEYPQARMPRSPACSDRGCEGLSQLWRGDEEMEPRQ
jgi:hypothetical protein